MSCMVLHGVAFIEPCFDKTQQRRYTPATPYFASLPRSLYKNKKALHLERPFGGLNVITSGDAWQFGPIGSVGAVYDNYLRLPNRASLRDISAMFWKREDNSFNCFKELTVERRCKDPWL